MALDLKRIDTYLLNQFAHYCPEVLKESLNDAELVNQLRNWVSGIIRCSSHTYLLNKDYYESYTVNDWLRLFENDSGGVSDAGSAIFLKKIYNTFGLRSAWLCYGFSFGNTSFSRAVTLVEISTPNGNKIIPQDVFLNSSIVGYDEEPLDFLEILELISQERHRLLLLKEEPVTRYALYNSAEAEQANLMHTLEFVAKLPNGANKYRMNICNKVIQRHFFKNPAGKSALKIMAEDGYPLNAFSLMLYPLSLQGDWQTEKYFEQIKSVIQKRQPIRKRYWDLIHFENDNIKQVHTNPPEVEGWVPFWHGFWQMEKVRSKEKIANDRTVHVKPQDDLLSEGDFERDIFLSIIRQFSDKYFVMVELGAGRGDWCLSAAGTITHQLISPCPSSYYCLAVEGEPTHCEWTREHFQKQKIAGDVVFGAITDRDGEIGFHVGNPADNYGQQIGGNYLVPAYTLDTLLAQYHLSHVSLLHVDVQGAEFEVIKGAMKSIIENKIEYIMIGTHMRNNIPLNDTLKSSTELLKYFELLIDIYPKSGANDIWYADGQRAAYLPVDGMQVFRRKI